MKIVALTGGIGSGKSTVAKMFKAWDVPVYDSDKEAKRLLGSSKKLRNEIISLLGKAAYDGKRLNKTYVANKIFEDKQLLLAMNKIVHPAVRKHFTKWAKKQEAAYVIQEAAIIFENGNQHNYDVVILVTAPQEVRIQRVMERDGVTKKQVLARMKNQWKDSDKIPLSDFVIESVDLKDTADSVSAIHMALHNSP